MRLAAAACRTSGVPAFDGSHSLYAEYRKRAKLYNMRCKLEGKEKLVAVMLISNLTGRAWDACSELLEDSNKLESDTAFDILIALLDARFKFDERTELPTAFENYFYKGGRRGKENFFDFIARTRELEREVTRHKIVLPDTVRGWLLLRRSGLSRDETTLVMSQVDTDLSFDKVASVLQHTFGQDTAKDIAGNRDKRSHAYRVDDGFHELIDTGYGSANDADDWYHDGDSSSPPPPPPPYQDDVYYGHDDHHHDHWDHHYDDEWSHEPIDSQQGYYHDHDPDDEAFASYDVDAYDEIYSNYVDARKQMNDLRLARGFYPIVALAPQTEQRQDRSTSKGSPDARGRGSARSPRTSKGRGRSTKGSPGSSRGRAGKRGGKTSAAERGATAAGKGTSSATCLRCGKTGHWARDCL